MADFSEADIFLLSTFPSAPSRPTFLTDSEQSDRDSSECCDARDSAPRPQQHETLAAPEREASRCWWSVFSQLWKKNLSPSKELPPESLKGEKAIQRVETFPGRIRKSFDFSDKELFSQIHQSRRSSSATAEFGVSEKRGFSDNPSCKAFGQGGFDSRQRFVSDLYNQPRDAGRTKYGLSRNLRAIFSYHRREGSGQLRRRTTRIGSSSFLRRLNESVASQPPALNVFPPSHSQCLSAKGRIFVACGRRTRGRRARRKPRRGGADSALELNQGRGRKSLAAAKPQTDFTPAASTLSDLIEENERTEEAEAGLVGSGRPFSQTAGERMLEFSCLYSPVAALLLPEAPRAFSFVDCFSVGFWKRVSAILVVLFLLQLGRAGVLLVLLSLSFACLLLRYLKISACHVEKHGIRWALPSPVRSVLEEKRLLDLLQLHLVSGRLGFYLSRVVALSLGKPSHEEALALLEGFPSSAVALLLQRGPVNALPSVLRRVYFGCALGAEEKIGETAVSSEILSQTTAAESSCRAPAEATLASGLSLSEIQQKPEGDFGSAHAEEAVALRETLTAQEKSTWSFLPLKKHSASEEAVVKKLALSAGDAPWVKIVGNISPSFLSSPQDAEANTQRGGDELAAQTEAEGPPKLLLFYDQKAQRPASDILAAEIVQASDKRVGKFWASGSRVRKFSTQY